MQINLTQIVTDIMPNGEWIAVSGEYFFYAPTETRAIQGLWRIASVLKRGECLYEYLDQIGA